MRRRVAFRAGPAGGGRHNRRRRRSDLARQEDRGFPPSLRSGTRDGEGEKSAWSVDTTNMFDAIDLPRRRTPLPSIDGDFATLPSESRLCRIFIRPMEQIVELAVNVRP